MSEAAPEGNLLIYQDGALNLQVRLGGNTLWLTQAAMAELYQTTKQNISLHLRNIFDEGELPEESVVKEYLTTAADGKNYSVLHYSLDVILAVGYRVRSHRGTQFRQWATARLKELLIKGFTLDDERIKQGRTIGRDYFDELLERIRAIRASERLFYQKITDIYSTSIDYDPSTESAKSFFATVQNKLHWAVHGHTAAELIKARADASRPNMGLTTWKNAPGGPVRKADVSVAKNYLSANELHELNRVVNMYLDYAEDQAARGRAMHMADWAARLDAFLEFNERNILTHAGKVSHELAQRHADEQFQRFDAERHSRAEVESDFDREARRLMGNEKPKPKAAKPKPQKRKKGGKG